MFVACVWFRCDVECVSRVFPFQNLGVCTQPLPRVSRDLYGQTNIQQTILLGEEKSLRFGHLYAYLRQQRENRITAYEPRCSYNIHSGLTCHSVKKGKSCQGAVSPSGRINATHLEPRRGGFPYIQIHRGVQGKGKNVQWKVVETSKRPYSFRIQPRASIWFPSVRGVILLSIYRWSVFQRSWPYVDISNAFCEIFQTSIVFLFVCLLC